MQGEKKSRAKTKPSDNNGKPTPEQFEAALWERAGELSKSNGSVDIIPVWYLDPLDPVNGKPIVGFLKEPNRPTKANIMDKLMNSKFTAATIALQACLMKDESDSRLQSGERAYDAITFSAGLKATEFCQLALDQLKKNWQTVKYQEILTT